VVTFGGGLSLPYSKSNMPPSGKSLWRHNSAAERRG